MTLAPVRQNNSLPQMNADKRGSEKERKRGDLRQKQFAATYDTGRDLPKTSTL